MLGMFFPQDFVGFQKPNFSKNNGKNKARSPYEENDNQFYMFYYQNTSKFYLISQDILITDNCLKSNQSSGKTKMLFIRC